MSSTSDFTTHTTISPAILYWGTPVVIVSTENPDGTTNLAPISSNFWLGHRCLIGLESTSQTTSNILRTKQCVLNLPDESMSSAINGLARTTGTEIVPPGKAFREYRYVQDKFAAAKVTKQPSDLVRPSRVKECPVQMEGEVVGNFPIMEDTQEKMMLTVFEVKIVRVHIWKKLKLKGYENRIDADKWKPMIMSFSKLYGLQGGELQHSVLAEIDEEKYRVGDL